jgi:hypothetical protein
MRKAINILLLLMLIPVAIGIGLLIDYKLQPVPLIPPLPNPNGYDDLVKAGKLVSTNSIKDWEGTNVVQLRELVSTNAKALSLARIGLGRECRMPLDSACFGLSTYHEFKTTISFLTGAFLAEGKLAEKENRPGDAAKSYVDILRLANELPRGGLAVDWSFATFIEDPCRFILIQMQDALKDAKTCRDAAAALEALDARRPTWEVVLKEDDARSRQTFLGYVSHVCMMVWPTWKEAIKTTEQRFKDQQYQSRCLTVDLAARAYELEKGHRPASIADLVSDYLKAIPLDPHTGTNMVYSPR